MSEYYAVVYSNSLSHHGIKGQKWGQRRYQNEDGSLTDAGRSRYGSGFIGTRLESGRNYRLAKKAAKEARKARDNQAYKEVENAERSIEKGYKRGQNLSKKDLARQDAAYRKYNSDLAKSKIQYKSDIAKAKADRKEANSKAREAKKAETRNKVREYKKQFDKASEMSDAADEKWREARSQYDSLAKTRIGRIREVIKAQKGNGSAAAKEYLKNADIASEMQDKADAAWRETHKKRMETGKTAVGRFINAVRYN